MSPRGRETKPTRCPRRIGLLFGTFGHDFATSSDLEISGFTVHTFIGFVADLFFSCTLESGFKNNRIRCRIRRMRVDGSRIRKEKVAESKISGYVWTGPQKDVVPLSGSTQSVVLIVWTGKKWEKHTVCGLKLISIRVNGATCTGEKKFTLAVKVYNRWTLTLIGHPYSSARIQTKPYQLKGWIRTKRAWNGGKKWWTTMESRSKFPRRTYKNETLNNYRGTVENKVVEH